MPCSGTIIRKYSLPQVHIVMPEPLWDISYGAREDEKYITGSGHKVLWLYSYEVDDELMQMKNTYVQWENVLHQKLNLNYYKWRMSSCGEKIYYK